jgi:hypothetical protein
MLRSLIEDTAELLAIGLFLLALGFWAVAVGGL